MEQLHGIYPPLRFIIPLCLSLRNTLKTNWRVCLSTKNGNSLLGVIFFFFQLVLTSVEYQILTSKQYHITRTIIDSSISLRSEDLLTLVELLKFSIPDSDINLLRMLLGIYNCQSCMKMADCPLIKHLDLASMSLTPSLKYSLSW